MVKGDNVIVVQCLSRLRIVADCRWVGADFGLGKNDAEFHRGFSLKVHGSLKRGPPPRASNSTQAAMCRLAPTSAPVSAYEKSSRSWIFRALVSSSSHQGFSPGLRGGLASTSSFFAFLASACATLKW